MPGPGSRVVSTLVQRERAYRVEYIQGRELGLVATQQIPCSERIIKERPLLRHVSIAQGISAEEVSKDVAALGIEEQASFWALAHSKEVWGEVPTAVGIFCLNAYPMKDFGDGRTESAISPTICRINHSCSPNVHVAWNPRLEQMTVHALRPISAGEELLSTYLEYGLPYAERQSILRRKFGFVCSCALCSLSEAEREMSDLRQQRFMEIDAQIAAFPRKAHEPQLLDLVNEKLRLMEAEGLPNSWGQIDMMYGFSRCVVLGDMMSARGWLTRSIAAARTMQGSDCIEVLELTRILDARPAEA